MTEAEVIRYLSEQGIMLNQVQSLVDGFDRLGDQAIREGANEVLAIFGEDELNAIIDALVVEPNFAAIAREIYSALQEHWQAQREESISLACKY